jgi:hypothetical protein
MKRQQFVHCPAMVGDPSGHGRCCLLHRMQTRMRRAKVIDRAHQEHPLVQRQGLACQGPATACQWRKAFPKRRVEPLNVRRVDHAVPLRPTLERLHTCRRAGDKAPFGRDHSPSLIALDDLRDANVAPRTQPGPSTRTRAHGITKGLPNGPDVGHQAIGTDQQWPTCGTAPTAHLRRSLVVRCRRYIRFPKAQMSLSSQVRSDAPSAPTCFAHQSRPPKVVSARYANVVRKTAGHPLRVAAG